MSDSLQMLLASVIIGVVLVGGGALTLWLARRSERGSLARNPVAGIRTALTLSSDAAWFAAQRAAAPRTRIAGWGAVGGGLLIVVLGLGGLSFALSTPVLVVVTLGSAGWLLAWTLAGAVRGPAAARDAVDRAG